MSSLSSRYRNIKYSIEVVSNKIESAKTEKNKERFGAQLKELKNQLSDVVEQLKSESEDLEAKKREWSTRVKALYIDAYLDESLNDEIKEKVVLSLLNLIGEIDGYKVS